MIRSRLSRSARLALTLLLRHDHRDSVLGDLEEELAALERAGASRTRRVAHVWCEVSRTLAAPLRMEVLARIRAGSATRRRPPSRREASMLSALCHDLLHAARTLGRAPLTTTFAAAVLALGLGGTAAVWSVLESMVLDPLRFEEPERLLGFWADGSWSLEEVELARTRLHAVDALAAFDPYVEASLEVPGGASLLPAANVTCEYFAVLRVPALIGRTPVPSDCEAGAEPVAVLAYESWQRLFGGDRGLVGRTLRIGGDPATVIGVLPSGFADPAGRLALWLGVRSDPADPDHRNNHSYSLLGRLAPGADLTAAQDDAERLARELGATFAYPPDFDKSKGAAAIGLREQLASRLAPPLRALLIAAACVLAIACANVANLQLVQALRRHGELLVRAALGANRLQLIRQLLVESALLVLVAAGAALLLARAGLAAVPWLLPPDTARLEEVRLTTSALGLTAALAVVAILALAFAPATRTRLLTGSIRRPGLDRNELRLRDAFVVAQTALAVVLLLGALSAVRHFDRLLEVDTGFDPSDVTLVRLELPSDAAEAARPALADRLEARLASLPGVQAIGAVQRPPLTDGWVMPLEREDRPRQRDDVAPTAFWRAVTAGYFGASDLGLVRGRLFGPGDDAAAPPVALVNEELARRFFGGEDPLGRRVRMPLHEHYSTVVGIVRDERLLGPGVDAPAILYQPYAQAPATRSLTFLLETPEGRPGAGGTELSPAARSAVAEVDPGIAVAEIEALDDALARRLQPLRSLAALLAALATFGVALGALGLFGVLSTNVLRRTREIGVRMAVGASATQVLRLVARQSLLLTATGLAVGLALAFVLLRYLGASLAGFRPTSLEALAVALTLAGAAFLASLWPALRASRIEPTSALRSE